MSENNATLEVRCYEAQGEERRLLEQDFNKAKQEGDLPENIKFYFTDKEFHDDPESKELNPERKKVILTKTNSLISDEVLKAIAPSTLGIITRSTGFNHALPWARHVPATYLKEYCAPAVAQFSVAQAMNLSRHVKELTNAALTFERNKVPTAMEWNSDKTALVVGVGNIGHEIYQLLQNNGLTVLGYDADKKFRDVDYVPLIEGVEGADIVISGMNLNDNPDHPLYNVGFFNEVFFSHARKRPYFVNCMRGEQSPPLILVDEHSEGRIRGAALDVFPKEKEVKKYLQSQGFRTEDVYDRVKVTDLIGSADRSIQESVIFIVYANRMGNNLLATPHQAFNTDDSVVKKSVEATAHLCDVVSGKGFAYDVLGNVRQ